MDIDDCLCTGARNLNFFCISTNDAGNIFSFKYNGVAKFSLQDILKAYLLYIVNVNRGVNQNIDINKSTMDHNFQINMEAFKNFDINKIQLGSNTGNDVFDITGFLKYFNENNNNNQANLQINGNNNVGFKHITTPHYNIDVNQNIINHHDVGGYDNGGGAIADDRSAVVNQVNQLISGVFKSKSVINTNTNLNSQIQEFTNILINNLNQNQGYNSELIITSNYDIKAKLEALRQILIEAAANGNGNVTVYTNGVQFDVQAALETIANAIASVEEKLRVEAEAKALEQNNQVIQQNKQMAVVNQVDQLIASAFKTQTIINTNVDLNSKIQEFINILINSFSQNQGYNSELTVTTYFDIKAKLEALRQILIEATTNGNGNFAIYTNGVQFNVHAALEAIINALAFVESKLRAETEAKAQEQTNQVNQQNQQIAVVNQVDQLIASAFKSQTVINTNVDLNSKIQEFINILINNLSQNQGYNSELTVTTYFDIKAKLEALRQILIEATTNGNGNFAIYTNGVRFDVHAALEAIINALAFVESKLRAEAEAKTQEQTNQLNQQNHQRAVVNQVDQLIASAFKTQTIINTNVDLNSKIQEFINILINSFSQNQGYNSELTVTTYFDIKAKLEALRQILIEATTNGNGNFAIYTNGVQFNVHAALEAIINALAFVESKLRAEAEAKAQEQTNQVNQQIAVVNQVDQLIASAFKSQTVINTNVDLNSKIQEFINILINSFSQNQGYNSELTVTTYFDIKAKLDALRQILIEAANGNGNFAIYTNGVQFDVRAALEAIANAIAFVEVKLRAVQVNQQNKQQANIQIQSGKQSHSKNSAHHASVYSGKQSVFYGGGGYNFGQFGPGGLVGVDGGTLGVIGLNGGSIIGIDGSNSIGMGGGGMIPGGSMGMGGGGVMGMGGGGAMGLGGGGGMGFSAGGEIGFSAGGGVDFGSGRAIGMGAGGAMGMGAGRAVGRGSHGLRGFNFGSMGYGRRGLMENPPSDRYIEDSNYQDPAGHSLNSP
ncbi:uncharacterized protein LOC126056472 [Helicoverpa armigera]|uniref:uncharacterized protein LOC126056472 n=1 Tax=Helicoverpa armigera TaxID=29058 RepID=UPI003083EDE6